MTQCEKILRHMEKYGSITSLEAMQEYGIMRLASRVSDLKKAGIPIRVETASGKIALERLPATPGIAWIRKVVLKMARKKQETLVLFPEVATITRKFSDAQFGVLMRAVFSYRFDGEVYSGDDAAVDVAQELRNMRGWLMANPKNRKTKAGIKRFVNGWLSREQNRARPEKQSRTGPSGNSVNNQDELMRYF